MSNQNLKNIFFFYLFTFKEQPCWLNIPLGFFTFFFTFKECSW